MSFTDEDWNFEEVVLVHCSICGWSTDELAVGDPHEIYEKHWKATHDASAG